ncbi:hypothetical protein B0H14DRAFT_2623867 [Mycena olivaceomarginata]|nr:hypothetical protein B0H14DRAFT_2623867 [Mycena olivaceomarginata]
MPSAFGLGPCGAGETHFFPPYASHAIFLSLAPPPPPPPASDEAGPSNAKPWVDPTTGVDVAAIRHTGNVPNYARSAQCPVQVVHAAGLAFSLAVVAGMRSHGKKRWEWIPYRQRVLRVPDVERQASTANRQEV